MWRRIAVASFALFGARADAQDDYGGGWGVPSLDTAISIGQDVVNSEMIMRNGAAAARRDAGNDHRSGGLRRFGEGEVVPTSAPINFVSTPQSFRLAQTAYIERLQKKNPTAARRLQAEFGKHDFGKIYSDIVRPFGLRANDAADALAGYTVLGWLIANGAPDPSPAAVRAVRDQFAGRLAAAPAFRSADRRRELGEELMITFVAIHSGWQSARREGKLSEYANGVAAMFARNDIQLRQLRLTSNGFEPRG